MYRTTSIISANDSKTRNQKSGLFSSFRSKKTSSSSQFAQEDLKSKISQPTNLTTSASIRARPLSQASSSTNLNDRHATLTNYTTSAINSINKIKGSTYVSAVARERGTSFNSYKDDSSIPRSEMSSGIYDTSKAYSVDQINKIGNRDSIRSLKTRSSVPNLTSSRKRPSTISQDSVSNSFLSMLADISTKENQIPTTIEESEYENFNHRASLSLESFEDENRLSTNFEHYTFALQELSQFNSDFDLSFEEDFTTSVLKGLDEISNKDDFIPRKLRRTKSIKNLNDFINNNFYAISDKRSIENEILQQEQILRKLQNNFNLELENDMNMSTLNNSNSNISESSSLESSPSQFENSSTNSSTTTLSTTRSKVSIKLIQNALFIGIEDESDFSPHENHKESIEVNDKNIDLGLDFEKILLEEEENDQYHDSVSSIDIDKDNDNFNDTIELEYDHLNDTFDAELSWESCAELLMS